GDSAGGNLSAVVSQLTAPSSPTCQALIYPAVDFSYETESHRDMEHGHIIPRDRVLWYTEQYLRDEQDKADLRASPLRAPRLAGQPPTFIVTAGFDPLRDEGKAYGDRLRAAGVDVVYREYTGQIHAFVSLTKAIPQGMAATLEVADYLRRRLAGADDLLAHRPLRAHGHVRHRDLDQRDGGRLAVHSRGPGGRRDRQPGQQQSA